MKTFALGVAAACLAMGVASAQTTTGTPGSTGTGSGSTGSTAAVTPAPTNPDPNQQKAGGDTNQAVATTSANAATPAKGSNSFTLGQARSRIAQRGFTNVTALKKDNNGVWRGRAQKDGSPVNVWLDYKGSVGQQ